MEELPGKPNLESHESDTDSSDADNDVEMTHSKKPRGRKSNATFLFAPEHLLHSTHVQRLRSKFMIPQLVGRVPRYPRHISDDPVHVVIASRFALYALTLFKPWDLLTGVPSSTPNWQAYTRYVDELSLSTPLSREWSILQVLMNLAEGLHGNVINPTRKMLVSKHRARAVKPWKDLPSSLKPDDPNESLLDIHKVVPEHNMDQAGIDAIRTILMKKTTMTSTTRRDNTSEYLSKSKQRLVNIFEATRNKQLGDEIATQARECNAMECDALEKGKNPAVPLSALRVTSIGPTLFHGRANCDGHQKVVSIIARLKEERFSIAQMNDIRGVSSADNFRLVEQLQLPLLREPAITMEEVKARPMSSLRADEPTLPTTIALSLSEEQQSIVRLVSTQFKDYVDSYRSILSSTGDEAKVAKEATSQQQLLLLILGPPGSGKSVVVNAITDIADAYATSAGLADSILLNTATTGAAAANLRPGARTVHNAFTINVNLDIPDSNVKLKPLTKDRLETLQQKLRLVSTVVICECSMLTAVMLDHVSSRYKQVKGNSKPFGGLDIILVGDFAQLPPTSGNGLYKDVVLYNDGADHSRNYSARYAANSPRADGSRLFQSFTIRQLETIQRSKGDEAHNRRLKKIRDEGIVDDDLISSLKVLSTEDFPAFATAPILVTSNAEINALMEPVLQQFARLHEQPVLKWRKPLASRTANIIGGVTDVPKLLDNLFSLLLESGYQYFVCGSDAVAYLTENLSPSVGLGNGVPVKLHSLVFQTQEDEDKVRNMVTNAKHGDIVDISDCVPKYVNVESPHLAVLPSVRKDIVEKMEQANMQSGGYSTVPLSDIWATETERSVIFPLALGSKLDRYSVESESGKPVYFWFRRFPYDVGLLSTLHKIQGKTIDRIILQLNQRRGSLMPINMFGLLVALSRVTHGDNIRILPPHEGESMDSFLAYLKELRPCPYLSRWRQGITENGSWQHRAPPTLDPKQTRKKARRTVSSKQTAPAKVPKISGVSTPAITATRASALASSTSSQWPTQPWHAINLNVDNETAFRDAMRPDGLHFQMGTVTTSINDEDVVTVVSEDSMLSTASIDAFVHGIVQLHQSADMARVRCFPVTAMNVLLGLLDTGVSTATDAYAAALSDFHGLFSDWSDDLLTNGNIYFPIHYGLHFFLAVLECVSQPTSPSRTVTIYFLDSASRNGGANKRWQLAKKVIQTWYDFATSQQPVAQTSSINPVWNTHVGDVPQQHDGTSCGLFVCAFIYTLIQSYQQRGAGLSLIDRMTSLNELASLNNDIASVRKWIMQQIVQGFSFASSEIPSIVQQFSVQATGERKRTLSELYDQDNVIPCASAQPSRSLAPPTTDQANNLIERSMVNVPMSDRILFSATTADAAEVRRLWALRGSDRTIVEANARFGNSIINLRTMQRLKPNGWLNDEIINFYMGLLQDHDRALNLVGKEKRSIFASSFFMSQLHERGVFRFHLVERWTRRLDFETLDKLFFPLRIGGNHFALIVVNIGAKEVHYYDSLFNETPANRYCSLMMRWLGMALREAFVGTDWTQVQHRDSPQQCNGSDCGVFVLTNAAFLANDLPLMYPCDIESMEKQRLRIAICLLKGSLMFTS